MILLHKQSLPPQLSAELHQLEISEEWDSIPDTDVSSMRLFFDNEFPKQKIRENLIKDQHGLCAYCMSRIKSSGQSMAIEHWKSLSSSKRLALKYSNLLGVCMGGQRTNTDERRVLCCDAKKKESEISIDPLNATHMSQIAYKRSGLIYMLNGDDELEKDINERLQLNGSRDSLGNLVTDTTTQLVKRRKDAYEQYASIMARLGESGGISRADIQEAIDKLMDAEKRT